MTTPRQDDRLLHEVQIMAAAGWRLYQRRADGADFASGSADSGISTGMHLVLLVITFGAWLPFLILIELASRSRTKFCRLSFDDQGLARYEPIKRPG